MRITRREFVLGGAASTCMCGVNACATLSGRSDTPALQTTAYDITADGDLIVSLDQVPELGMVGGAVKVRDGRLQEPVLIIHQEGRSFLAVSLSCRHGGREVEYEHARAQFRCVSFGHSKYDLEGKNLSGPAKKPLPVFPVSLSGATLTVHCRA